MKKNKIVFLLFLSGTLLFSCEKEDIDQVKPDIDMSAMDAFPVACDTLYFGENFTLKAVFTDNVELGSFNLDIHHNFDHHTHSTEVIECNLADKKEPLNPYILIQDFEIPEGSSSYEANLEISLPSVNGDGKYDEGDYHFHINLVDKNGWSTPYGVGVKMMYR
ncbi:MAG: DUF4625 domain-containing protein [Cytophagales bacterium]|nr:DUF4625 domain-containing protein [Cytophagales bacterium]